MNRPLITLRKRLTSIILLSIFVSSLLTQSVLAQTSLDPKEPVDYDFYASNDILWYDPNASCGVTPDANTGSVTLVGGENAEKTWNFFRAKGLSNEQTAGVMGNIQAESGFNPGIVEGGSGIGFGIAQWSFGRRTALEAAAREKGVDVADLGFQLEYLFQELNVRTADRPEYRQYGTEWKAVAAQTTIDDALVAFHHEFEISHLMDTADPRAAVIAARGGFAHSWFDKYASTTPGAGSGGAPGPACESVPTGNLSKTLLAYAWPTYKGNDPIPTPAWKNVMDTYPAKGRYIGAGIDCGGFVTNLIIDSGFDVTYNYKSVVAEGAGNTEKQLKWLDENWQNLNATIFAGSGADPAQLKPGDVAIVHNPEMAHTFVYVGEVPGFESRIASAAEGIRAPMADTDQTAADPNYTWYRKR